MATNNNNPYVQEATFNKLEHESKRLNVANPTPPVQQGSAHYIDTLHSIVLTQIMKPKDWAPPVCIIIFLSKFYTLPGRYLRRMLDPLVSECYNILAKRYIKCTVENMPVHNSFCLINFFINSKLI